MGIVRTRRRAVAVVAVVGACAAMAACGGTGSGAGNAGRVPSAGARNGAASGSDRPTAGTVADELSAFRASDKPCGTVNGDLVPKCGAWWGIYSVRGATLTSSVTDIEHEVGRHFDIVLRYHDFSTGSGPGRFPDSSERTLGRSRILFFAWESKLYRQKTSYKWRDITAGKYDDSVIKPAAERVRAYGRKVFMSFDPEMDRQENRNERKGTAAEYVAAARHVHDVFQKVGAKNVIWVWTITGYLGKDSPQRDLASYPGDAYVDWVGWDPYNFYKCTGVSWKSFDTKMYETYQFLERNGFGNKPFILPEFGTQYDPADPARSRVWYREIPDVLKHKYPNVAGLVRFDAGTGCDTQLDSGPGMLRSFAEVGRSPYLNPSRK